MIGPFKYYQASESTMADLEAGERECKICKSYGSCFRLEAPSDHPIQFGCSQCLLSGHFAFWHSTDAGVVEGNQLIPFEPPKARSVLVVAPSGEASPGGMVVEPLQKLPPHESVVELARTPRFSSWNDVSWGVCCGDFMVYRGDWTAADFIANFGKEAGRSLFTQTAGKDWAWLWPDEAESPTWDASVHMFHCQSCGTRSSRVDAS